MNRFPATSWLPYFGQEVGHFFEGRVIFYFFQVGVFLGEVCGSEKLSGGGSFLEEGDIIFFFEDVGGSPLLGGNRAFMAEPSDGPAINDGLGRKKGGGVDMKKRNEEKKMGKKLN